MASKKATPFRVFIKILLIMVGTFISSIAINGLFIPHHILSGGIAGIAILFNIKYGIEPALVIILLNIPIFIIGYRFINRRFIIYSIIGMISYSFFLWLTRAVVIESQELLTTILLGGLINGICVGLIFRVNGSVGGTDIVSKVLNMQYSYSIATFNYIFNLVIVGLSAFIFGIDLAVITLATMYISSITITFIVEGSNIKRTVLIVTENKEEISARINEKLHRGCTIIEGVGAYTGNPRHILYAVISTTQLGKVRSIVKNIDPEAFINVIETRVVFGNGFIKIDKDD